MDADELARILRWYKNGDATSYEVADAIERLIAKMIEEAKAA